MLGSFFLLNFFIGVLFLKYTEAQRSENKGYTEAHKNWIAIQDMITKAHVAHDKLNMPDILWRFRLWKFINNTHFEKTIMTFIILNMLQMACDYEGSPPSVGLFLQVSNYIFTLVFLVECVLKLLVYGLSYFQDQWNKFDFFVVCASLVDLGLEPLGQGVDAGHTHAVEAAGDLVGPAVELAAGVELRQDHLDRRLALGGDHPDGNAPPIVADRAGAIAMQHDRAGRRVAGEGLVHRVVDDLPDQVVEPVEPRRTDVHPGSLADRFEPLEDLDRLGVVGGRRLARTLC